MARSDPSTQYKQLALVHLARGSTLLETQMPSQDMPASITAAIFEGNTGLCDWEAQPDDRPSSLHEYESDWPSLYAIMLRRPHGSPPRIIMYKLEETRPKSAFYRHYRHRDDSDILKSILQTRRQHMHSPVASSSQEIWTAAMSTMLSDSFTLVCNWASVFWGGLNRAHGTRDVAGPGRHNIMTERIRRELFALSQMGLRDLSDILRDEIDDLEDIADYFAEVVHPASPETSPLSDDEPSSSEVDDHAKSPIEQLKRRTRRPAHPYPMPARPEEPEEPEDSETITVSKEAYNIFEALFGGAFTADMSFDDLLKAMTAAGFSYRCGGGSKVHLDHPRFGRVTLHRPHRKDQSVKLDPKVKMNMASRIRRVLGLTLDSFESR